jgi:hypothetical protein
MLRRALVVGIAGWLCAQEPVPTPQSPAPVAAPTPRAQAEQFVRELAEPGKQNAAVQGLVALGDAAVPALHKALLDRRSDVLQWALFACSGLHGDCASLRSPVERLLASKDLGVALMARRAWPAVEGRSGVLLTLSNGNVVLVTDTSEKVLLTPPDPFHTELLPNGNLLSVSHTKGSVRELQSDGSEVWTHGAFQQPVDCKRLPDGNTLVCSYTGRKVVELKPDGTVAWSIETPGLPFEADRLANGNTLITQFNEDGVIEVDRNGKTVWSFASPHLSSASRQLDGTTLVTDRQSDRIRLVGADGKVQRTWKCDGVMHAELLPNGHLVVNRRDTVLVLDDRALPLWVTERKEILGMQVLGAGPFRANSPPAEPSPQKN